MAFNKNRSFPPQSGSGAGGVYRVDSAESDDGSEFDFDSFLAKSGMNFTELPVTDAGAIATQNPPGSQMAVMEAVPSSAPVTSASGFPSFFRMSEALQEAEQRRLFRRHQAAATSSSAAVSTQSQTFAAKKSVVKS